LSRLITVSEHCPSPIARTLVPSEIQVRGVFDRRVWRVESVDGMILLMPSIGSSFTTGPTVGVVAGLSAARASARVVVVDVVVAGAAVVLVDCWAWIGA
jgi:hypothetical protein